jgi:hypothetical protein
MPIDASIVGRLQPMQFQDPVNQLAKVMQIKDMQANQEANAMKADEYRRGIADQNALREALSQPGADPANALLRLGRVKEAGEYQKGQAAIAKDNTDVDAKKLEMAHKRVEMVGQGMGWLRQNPSIENAQMLVQGLVQQGIAPPEMAQQLLAQIQRDPSPQNIAKLATMGYQQALQAKDQLPKYDTRNLGGSTQMTATDPVTGQVKVVNSIQNTASPESVLSAETQRRGQNMVDALSKEANGIQQQASRTQVVETPEGVMLIDKGTGQARPATAGGKPLQGKPSAATEKELLGLRQQNSIIDGAIAAVDKTPDAFSMGRGIATMAGAIPESVAGRFDNDAQRQARSYVFNNVSKVINERAGAAQSAQELARLRSFLPAETDNADQIKSKLQAFKSYLSDMQAGTKGTGGATGGWSIQRVGG